MIITKKKKIKAEWPTHMYFLEIIVKWINKYTAACNLLFHGVLYNLCVLGL